MGPESDESDEEDGAVGPEFDGSDEEVVAMGPESDESDEEVDAVGPESEDSDEEDGKKADDVGGEFHTSEDGDREGDDTDRDGAPPCVTVTVVTTTVEKVLFDGDDGVAKSVVVMDTIMVVERVEMKSTSFRSRTRPSTKGGRDRRGVRADNRILRAVSRGESG